MEMDKDQAEHREKTGRRFEELFELRINSIIGWGAGFAIVRRHDARVVGMLGLGASHGCELFVDLKLDTRDRGVDDQDSWEEVIAKVPEHSSSYYPEYDMELSVWESVLEAFDK